MREDMGRCVIERPRTRSYALSRKVSTFGKIVDEGDSIEYYGATKIPVARRRAYGYESKTPTDVLGPINGYLRSKIGCYWDDVYSEICRVLSKGGIGVEHVRYQHIHVATCVEKYNGKLYEVGRWGDNCLVDGFYVDPDTGKLAWAKNDRYRGWYTQKVKGVRVAIPNTASWYVVIDGLWFLGTYEKLDSSPANAIKRRDCYSYKTHDYVWPHFQEANYVWKFTKVKQCNKKEIAQARSLLAAMHGSH